MEITTTWIFGVIWAVGVGIIGWSLKELFNRFKQDKNDTNKKIEVLQSDIKGGIKEVKSNLDGLKKEFEIYKEKQPEKYVLKDEFNREINKLDEKLDSFRDIMYKKLDDVKDDILDLNKNVSALLANLNNR